MGSFDVLSYMKNEIIIYQSTELTERIEVKIEDDSVWLNQEQIAYLFKRTKQNISLHIRNCFRENELEVCSTVKEYLTVHYEGKRKIRRQIKLYNLDVIISVGYRVKSKQGTLFRIWANQILRDYLLKGYTVNKKINHLENRIDALQDKVQHIDLQLNTKLIPTHGIFFEGQVFDAYELASRIIRSAKKNIILIDNYIDESTLILLTKKEVNVSVLLLTKSIYKQLELDIKKANEQYGSFEWQPFKQSHDRFLIIDEKEVYHLGASLKDLGKKWFAFSMLDLKSVESIMKAIHAIR